MHAAEEAEVPLPLLAPIERELGLAGREHGVVPVLDDKADLLQQHCRLSRRIDVAPLSDHALDDKDEVPTHGEHRGALAVHVLHRLSIRRGTQDPALRRMGPVAPRMDLRRASCMRRTELLGVNVMACVHHAWIRRTTDNDIDLAQRQVLGIVPEHERHGVPECLPARSMPRHGGGERGEAVRFELVWSKNSCGFTLVVFEEAPKPFTTPNQAFTYCVLADRRKEQHVALALMISLVMIMRHILRQHMVERRFPTEVTGCEFC